jgi:putative transposase
VNADGSREVLGLEISSDEDGAGWQRCRTHYLRNLLTNPKTAQSWVATLVRTVFDQPDTDEVKAPFARVLDTIAEKLPNATEHLDTARDDLLAFTAFPARSGARSGRTTRKKT